MSAGCRVPLLQNYFKIFAPFTGTVAAINRSRPDITSKNSSYIMSKQFLWVLSWVLLLGWPTGQATAQALTLRQAVQTALNNYGTIRAKADYVKAARANVREVKNEYLPDLSLAAEQVYGTANSNYGPAIGYKTPAVLLPGRHCRRRTGMPLLGLCTGQISIGISFNSVVTRRRQKWRRRGSI